MPFPIVGQATNRGTLGSSVFGAVAGGPARIVYPCDPPWKCLIHDFGDAWASALASRELGGLALEVPAA